MDDLFTFLAGYAQLSAANTTWVDWVWFFVGVAASPVAVKNGISTQWRGFTYELEYGSRLLAGVKLLIIASLLFVASSLTLWIFEPILVLIRGLIIELAIILILTEKGPALFRAIQHR